MELLVLIDKLSNFLPHFEVGIEHAVWKTAHANPDTFQYTIASQLVHDKWGLNLSWLLVSVWYKATDKVGFAIIESSHELTKRDKID